MTASGDMTGNPALALDAAAGWTLRMDRGAGEGERALEAWLGESEANQDAYLRTQGLWDDLALLAPAQKPAVRRSWFQRPGMAQFTAIAATVLLLFTGVLLWSKDGGQRFATEIGGREVATLSDGSRVTLNTDTELHVAFATGERTVILDRGEAMFEVERDAKRPFVVEAAGRRITAIGTTFLVRRHANAVAVTLVEGRVKVESRGGTRMMEPGQRLILRDNGAIGIDRPAIDTVTSWRRGELVFSDTPIAEAVAEMNRYTRKPIRLSVDPGDRRLSGIFATNGGRQFGALVSELYDWTYREDANGAVIAGGSVGKR
ncbi:FecR family protein [Sphingomonas koreensis]